MNANITPQDIEMAQKCVECKLCDKARINQKGLAYWFVKHIEGGLCPYCKAYEKVYGKKAHEPNPELAQTKSLAVEAGR